LVREFGGDEGASKSSWAYVCYNIGQVLIASAGPFMMGAVTLFSRVWFAENERTTATSIAMLSNGVGSVIGFLNPIWLAPSAGQIPNIFYLGLVLSAIPIFGAMMYLPAKPRYAPSAAAEVEEQVGVCVQIGEMRQLLTNRSFCMVIACAGILVGVVGGWSSVFQSMLGPEGISETVVGWMGFANALAATIFGIAAGGLIDGFFHHRLKAGIMVSLVGTLLCLIIFTLMLLKNSFLGYTDWTLAVIYCSFGMFYGAAQPLFYELGAELMYPAKESTSAGILVFIQNTLSGAMISLNTYFAASTMNTILISIVAILVLSMIFVQEAYKRPSNDEKRLLAETPLPAC